eukprot:scaffold5558_cov131-Isochrysis_galbana.AAC.3
MSGLCSFFHWKIFAKKIYLPSTFPVGTYLHSLPPSPSIPSPLPCPLPLIQAAYRLHGGMGMGTWHMVAHGTWLRAPTYNYNYNIKGVDAAKNKPITVTDVQSDGRPFALPRETYRAPHVCAAVAAIRFMYNLRFDIKLSYPSSFLTRTPRPPSLSPSYHAVVRVRNGGMAGW